MKETLRTAARERILVQVFAKAPVAGEVKTRLISVLGATGATELYCRLVRHTLDTVALARVGDAEMWTTQPGESAFLQACRRPPGIPLHRQPGGDLGQRMSASILHGLARASAVLLVGADVPGMSVDDLREARDALAEGQDAVLGPAEDGGYWLIGVARHAPELFGDLPWSASGLLDASRARLRTLGWRWHELSTRWDIDRPEDVHRLARERDLGCLVADLLQAA